MTGEFETMRLEFRADEHARDGAGIGVGNRSDARGSRTFSQRAPRSPRDALERPMATSPMTPIPSSAIDAGSGTELIWIVAIRSPLVGMWEIV
jgi:hypothetical protein